MGSSPDEMGYEQKYADEAAEELLRLAGRTIMVVTGAALVAWLIRKVRG